MEAAISHLRTALAQLAQVRRLSWFPTILAHRSFFCCPSCAIRIPQQVSQTLRAATGVLTSLILLFAVLAQLLKKSNFA